MPFQQVDLSLKSNIVCYIKNFVLMVLRILQIVSVQIENKISLVLAMPIQQVDLYLKSIIVYYIINFVLMVLRILKNASVQIENKFIPILAKRIQLGSF